MAEVDHKKYLEEKKRRRKIHQRLKETKENQEIYHKLMGSDDDETPSLEVDF